MKKLFGLFLCFIAVLLIGCSNNDIAKNNNETVASSPSVIIESPSFDTAMDEPNIEHIMLTAEEQEYIRWDNALLSDSPDTFSGVIVDKKVFSDDDYKTIISTLVGSQWTIVQNYEMSKSELAKLIQKIEYNREHCDFSKDLITNDGLKDFQVQEKKAPELSAYQVIEDITSLPSGQFVSFTLLTADEDHPYVVIKRGENDFYFYRSETLNVQSESFLNALLHSTSSKHERAFFEWLLPTEPTITREAAMQEADSIISELHIPMKVKSIEPCTILTNYVERTEGWRIVYARNINGFFDPFDIESFGIADFAPPQKAAPWSRENCTIVIDEKGIASFTWLGASTQSTYCPERRIPAFSEVQPLITRQLFTLNETNLVREGFYRIVDISSVNVAVALLSTDQPDVGEYIPIWVVYYRSKWNDDSDIPENWQTGVIAFSMYNGQYVEPRITERKLSFELGGDR